MSVEWIQARDLAVGDVFMREDRAPARVVEHKIGCIPRREMLTVDVLAPGANAWHRHAGEMLLRPGYLVLRVERGEKR